MFSFVPCSPLWQGRAKYTSHPGASAICLWQANSLPLSKVMVAAAVCSAVAALPSMAQQVLVPFAPGCLVPLDVPADPLAADHGVAHGPRRACDLLRAPVPTVPFLHPDDPACAPCGPRDVACLKFAVPAPPPTHHPCVSAPGGWCRASGPVPARSVVTCGPAASVPRSGIVPLASVACSASWACLSGFGVRAAHSRRQLTPSFNSRRCSYSMNSGGRIIP